jgi:hypothetical protein
MISITSWNAVYGIDRAAASARPGLAPTFDRNLGGELCPLHAERFAGSPMTSATPTMPFRVRLGVGDLPAIKIQKFVDQPVPGSSVWRQPV